MIPSVTSYLNTTESAVRLAIFRVVWGVLMAVHVGHELFSGSGVPRYSEDFVHFKFPWFHWVPALPAGLVVPLLGVALVMAVLVAFGLFYRIAATVFFLLYNYLFLIDVSYYNNHYYLMALVSGILVVMNANAALSLDAHVFNKRHVSPVWQRHLLAFHIVLVYFYGGLSKLFNPEWLSGEGAQQMVVGAVHDAGLQFSDTTVQTLAQTMTFGGLFFDLFIGVLLFQKRTFWIGAVGVLFFNLTNAITFEIGVFPFIMIGGLVLFYPQDQIDEIHFPNAKKPMLVVFLSIYLAFQLLFPLRHLLIPGDSFWTSEGYLFSWNMKPGTKDVDATFFVHDRTAGLSYEVDPREYLTPPAYLALGKYPFVAPQFAQFLEGRASQWYIAEPEVTADLLVSRNRGPYRLVIDPKADLGKQTFHPLRRNAWIIEEPDRPLAK